MQRNLVQCACNQLTSLKAYSRLKSDDNHRGSSQSERAKGEVGAWRFPFRCRLSPLVSFNFLVGLEGTSIRPHWMDVGNWGGTQLMDIIFTFPGI